VLPVSTGLNGQERFCSYLSNSLTDSHEIWNGDAVWRLDSSDP